ncbi:hypothetical protein BEI72_14805 [Erwinia amylovora]|nr:hypothetical protein BEI72_14805 [Erwinia amylovora]
MLSQRSSKPQRQRKKPDAVILPHTGQVPAKPFYPLFHLPYAHTKPFKQVMLFIMLASANAADRANISINVTYSMTIIILTFNL